MFQGVADISNPMILAGVIWALALGFAAGNYACSLVHRLPRGRGILSDKPYCGNCRTPLATKDLFPVFSALLLGHKCRYCGQAIPKSHFWTEILVGALFVFSFLQYNYSEMFLLNVFLGTFLVILASIENNEGYLERRILVTVAVIGMILRVLQDHTLFSFISSGWYGMVIGAIIWYKQVKRVGHSYSLPDGAKLTAVGGLCAGEKNFAMFLMLFLTCVGLEKILQAVNKPQKKLPLSIPFALAITFSVLFPAAL